VGVKRLPRLQCLDALAPDEFRRQLVGLAEPEREHALPAEACVRHLADLRPAQAQHRVAGGELIRRQGDGGGVHGGGYCKL
jgi:hypothetical protein